ncbi:hypothetical protein ACF0H5_005731 [Mactra antiquata]
MQSSTVIGFVVLLGLVHATYACNQQACASLVSKCQLIKKCDCDMSDKKNCSCCNSCQLCLAQLYSECCSCVDMCPHPDPEDSIFKTSAIEEMPDPIPELFNVLTEEEDYLQRWTTHKYPVYYDPRYDEASNRKDFVHSETDEITSPHSMTNCTVAFMSKCMSMKKCKQSCKSMGAAKYRWFHSEGCCQCIGNTCIDYGLNEPMCLECKADEDEDVPVTPNVENSEGEKTVLSAGERTVFESDITKDEKIIDHDSGSHDIL